jgi:hypothetical protein
MLPLLCLIWEFQTLISGISIISNSAFLVAITTFVGGVIAGPLGLAAGGTIGGFTAAYTSKCKQKLFPLC